MDPQYKFRFSKHLHKKTHIHGVHGYRGRALFAQVHENIAYTAKKSHTLDLFFKHTCFKYAFNYIYLVYEQCGEEGKYKNVLFSTRLIKILSSAI